MSVYRQIPLRTKSDAVHGSIVCYHSVSIWMLQGTLYPLQMENLYKLELELLIVEPRNFLAGGIKPTGFAPVIAEERLDMSTDKVASVHL